MKTRDKKDLPEDVEGNDSYLKVTIYYDPDGDQCCIVASPELCEDDILDILSSGIAELSETPTPQDKGYLN